MKLFDISGWCNLGDDLTKYPYIGEIDCGANLFEVIEVDGKYYTPVVIGRSGDNAGMAGVIEVTAFDAEGEDTLYMCDLTCPYCGHRNRDSWELPNRDDMHQCVRCGGTMSFERIVTVEYSATPVKPPVVTSAHWI